MQQRAGHAPVRFMVVPGADHFSVLKPGSEVIANASSLTLVRSPPWMTLRWRPFVRL